MRLPRTMLVLAGSAAAAFVYLRYVRPWQLTWGATAAEVSRHLPSDDLVSHPTFDATRAITLEPPPEQVWPWLVQVRPARQPWPPQRPVHRPRAAKARAG